MTLLTLVGCGKLRDEQRPTPADALFPHAADYDAASAHGADALSHGQQACGACHDLGVTTGTTGTTGTTATGTTATGDGPPPCAECHQDYPHPDGWIDGSSHGQGTWGEGGDRTSCEACHAAPDLVAAERFACTSCHASWPHPAGWAEAGNHGSYALARGDASVVCGSCHGTDLAGGDVQVACTDCHSTWPHDAGWDQGSVHGAAHGADADACEGCHDSDGSGGTSGVACDRCHAGFPHQGDWAATGHVQRTSVVGEGTCATCHLAGDGPEHLAFSCAQRCHGGTETGW